MSLQLHRPDGRGGLEAHPPEDDDWRRLREPRWGASLPGRRLPPLANPEVNPTPTGVAVAFWLTLGALTFVLLVLGYGSGFWH